MFWRFFCWLFLAQSWFLTVFKSYLGGGINIAIFSYPEGVEVSLIIFYIFLRLLNQRRHFWRTNFLYWRLRPYLKIFGFIQLQLFYQILNLTFSCWDPLSIFYIRFYVLLFLYLFRSPFEQIYLLQPKVVNLYKSIILLQYLWLFCYIQGRVFLTVLVKYNRTTFIIQIILFKVFF